MLPDLTRYDWIIVNSSAGKDSQAMLDYLVELAMAAGVRDRLVVAHADLGRMEWAGTRELAERQAGVYGLRFEVVRKDGPDLLAAIERRGKFPDAARRYCTSDFKRGPVGKLFTRLWGESPARHYRPVRILNCMGLRAEESPSRAKKPQLARDDRATSGRRIVDVWLPIHDWTERQVWQRIEASGVEHHPAYDLGMPRLSCVFCVFASRSALLIAGRHNPELLAEYVGVEQRIGHTFKHGMPIAAIQAAVAAGEQPARAANWTA